MYANPYAQYQKIDLEAEIESASPHRLVAMLYEGFLTRVAQAKVAINNGDFEGKARNVTKAMNILVGLKGGLDPKHNQELADRLFELYDYCERRLLDASAQRDVSGFDEVSDLIREVKDAWDQVAPEKQNQPVAAVG